MPSSAWPAWSRKFAGCAKKRRRKPQPKRSAFVRSQDPMPKRLPWPQRPKSELRNFLESPAVTKKEKRGVADKISARLGASKILRNFLFVIIDHQRMHQLPEILETFQNVLRERQGIAEAEIF